MLESPVDAKESLSFMSSGRRIRWLRRRWVGFIAAALVAGTLGLAASGIVSLDFASSRRAEAPTAVVRRTDLKSEVLATGRIQSSVNTEVRCGVEQVGGVGRAGGSGSGGASTILSLIPDGTFVQKDDVLGTLDASEYEEMVRQQQIAVERVRAEHHQASLALEVAQIQADSYRTAEQYLVTEPLKGQIALGRSDLTRQADRLAWTQRMADMGYTSSVQVATEAHALKSATLSLAQLAMSLRNYQRYGGPKQLASLESMVSSAQTVFDFQSARLKREEERLAHYQTLVNSCTIRAPHDGFVIYANRTGRQPTVYVGAPVRERLRLFYLPDLSKMEVEVLIHESVVNRVRPEMPAHVRLEALPGREVEGRVLSVSLFPLLDRKSETGNEITYFLGRIQLAKPPAGLRPGMSAEVVIEAETRPGVLAVPPAAVTVLDGRETCYVVREERLEPRSVQLGQWTPSLLEITEGLEEGEEVLLDPSQVRAGTARPLYRR